MHIIFILYSLSPSLPHPILIHMHVHTHTQISCDVALLSCLFIVLWYVLSLPHITCQLNI